MTRCDCGGTASSLLGHMQDCAVLTPPIPQDSAWQPDEMYRAAVETGYAQLCDYVAAAPVQPTMIEAAEARWHALRAGRRLAFIGLLAIALTALLMEYLP